MDLTKSFVWKMTLEHKMCTINHSFRIWSQNRIWRPVEQNMCLLVSDSNQRNCGFFQKLQIWDTRFQPDLHILVNKNFWDMKYRPNSQNSNILVIRRKNERSHPLPKKRKSPPEKCLLPRASENYSSKKYPVSIGPTKGISLASFSHKSQ